MKSAKKLPKRAEQWLHCITYVAAHQQVRMGIEVGRLAVDDDELGAGLLGEKREARGRIDHERGTDGEEEVAGERLGLGPPHRRLGHGLAERNGGALDRRAAVRTVGRLAARLEAFPDPIELVAPLA